MTESIEAFYPTGATAAIANASTDGNSRVALPTVADGAQRRQLRVFNASDRTLWLEFGGSTVTAAAATSMPFGAGMTEVFGYDVETITHIAAVASGDAAVGSIYFTVGKGV